MTDKGCGHRLPLRLVFSWTPSHLAPLASPCSKPAASHGCPAAAPRLHAWHSLAGRLEARGPPSLMARTSPALPRCLDPALPRGSPGAGCRCLLAVSLPGAFRPVPSLGRSYPALCLCGCSRAVASLAVCRRQVVFWGNPLEQG